MLPRESLIFPLVPVIAIGGGTLQKISSYIFIITPASVDVSGDIQEILDGAFEVPSVHAFRILRRNE